MKFTDYLHVHVQKILNRLHKMLCLDMFVTFLELKSMKTDFKNYWHETFSTILMLKRIFEY